jgi:hypothetical protein
MDTVYKANEGKANLQTSSEVEKTTSLVMCLSEGVQHLNEAKERQIF